MSIAEAVATALGEWPNPSIENGQVLVPTHCLYPSNGLVTVTVTSGVGSFLVHDAWGAIEEVDSAGANFRPGDAAHMIRHVVTAYGCVIDDTGLIKAERTSQGDLISNIALVANASKDASAELLSRFRPRLRRNLKAELANLLEVRFPKHVIRNMVFVGASNKSHRFDNVVRLSGERQVIVDAVTREASSINAALVSHLDVRNANIPNVDQRIVYDDTEHWAASDLNLLRIGAPPVPLSRAPDVLERLAA